MKIKKLLNFKKKKKKEKKEKRKRKKLSSGIKLKGLQAKIGQCPRVAIELLKAAEAEHSHWADHQHGGRW